MTSRRTFIKLIPIAGLAAVAARQAMATTAAPAPNQVVETDPTAVSLGYKANSRNVDNKKFPKHADGQSCSNCQLFQGKAGDASGPCPIFAGKVVSSSGWCSAYVKKA